MNSRRPFKDHFSEDIFRSHQENYSPVSNLSYVCSLIEWAVCNQLTSIAAHSGNVEELQSACREHHSTKTAILKVKSDLLTGIYNKEVTCLVLLDLSAAFDKVNHKLLLNRLKYRFGINGTIFQWIKSYLTNISRGLRWMTVNLREWPWPLESLKDQYSGQSSS